MKNYSDLLQKALVTIFFALLLILLYGHFKGYDLSIPWNVTTTADAEEFPAHTFQKGPFQFSFTGDKYSLAETFSAGPVARSHAQDAFFLITIFLGICILLTVSTYLSRYWFIGVMALFIFFLINLHLREVGLFGFSARSYISVSILLLTYLLPGYLFHAFYTNATFTIRLLVFAGITAVLAAAAQIDLLTLQEQLISGSYFGLIILTLLFFLLIAEENVYAILYLITRSRGGKNNHIHFSIFTLIYIGFLALYYSRKSGLLDIEVTYFDPYILFAVSSAVAFWSLKFKKQVFENLISLEMARLCFTGLGILVFGFLGLSFFRGNDPVYEGMHYFIVYVHLGFGVMFFLYVIINFINPLSEGLQVYKIVYKERNFPYASAKLGGLAAVAAFFFLASKEPFLLFRAGHYNYLGAQAETAGQIPLSQEYYREGSIYGYDNHFSNYKLAYYQLQKRNIDEANYRFGRATLRYPSPQSFVNQAGTFAMEGETTPSIVSLKNGLRQFPGNSQILNNLGLIYTDLGNLEEARSYFEQSSGEAEWTNANKVNLWKVKSGFQPNEAEEDYFDGNLAVKTNILSMLLESNRKAEVRFDTSVIYPSYPLHRTAFLINSAWYFRKQDIHQDLANALTGTIEENMHNAAVHAIALNQYVSGRVNLAVRSLDQLQANAPKQEQAQYLNELGLIALEQHSLDIALQYFEKALSAGSEAAYLNKTAALMEMKKFEEAQEWAEHLTQMDSAYTTLANDLATIDKRENPDPGQQLSRLYYYYPEYSLAEISGLLQQSDSTFMKTLWQKISRETLITGDFDAVKSYIDLFKNRLDNRLFSEARLIIGLVRNEYIEVNHPVSKILQLNDSSVIASRLAEEANKNAYNVPLILAITDLLEEYDIQLAYDVLVEAVAINNRSTALYKRYALTALDAGLFEYAADVLPKIRALTSEAEYEHFHRIFTTKREKIEADTAW